MFGNPLPTSNLKNAIESLALQALGNLLQNALDTDFRVTVIRSEI